MEKETIFLRKEPSPIEKRRSNIKEQLLNLIYPKICGICEKGKNTYLCKKCENKLKEIAIFGKDEYLDKYFENHYYIFKYDSIIRNLIIDYKFNEKPYLYRSIFEFLNKYQKKYVQFEIYDIIIPVPISKKRNKERGYNQSLLIAREIAKNEKVKLRNNVILKVKNNNTQSKLNKEERAENVKNVYKITNNKEIIDKNILLIDDIFTTGATLNECSKMLKQASAKKVDVLTIAKD